MMDLEFGQLDRRYERLRIRKPELERRLLGSLAENGQRVPIVVVAGDSELHFIVIDGYKRVRALEHLHADTVASIRWDIEEQEAMLIERFLRDRQSESPLEQGWLLHEMTTRFGLTLEELARRVGRSTSWASRRLGLVLELPEQIQERVRRGEILPHAAMKYLLPLARANRGQCVQIAEAIAGKGVSSRQAAQLYAVWRDGSSQIRQRVAADPMLFLRAQNVLEAPAADLTSLIRQDLDIITATARRARRRLQQAAGRIHLLPPEGEALQRDLGLVRRDLDRLEQQLTKEISDVERGDSSSDFAACGPGA
jgi:ParB/RepB/Spo0J family partition protein